ncbi:MAG TPA: DUF1501 domain-containing protein [Gaiellaceae bacterium]|nr:DUF1501 domain-containing protein [Gaiellaceae bacterium]
MASCCNEFSRSSLVRGAVAEAASGLPAIEPGMPLPAGTGLDRRSFVLRSAGLALAVYGAGALELPLYEDGVLAAAEAAPNQPVLVSLFLDGGADSLSLLAPVGDPDYKKLRPKLALPDSGLAFTEDPRLRWHPSAASLRTLHLEGKLTVLPTVGYTDADQSHFTSRHYWEVGATNAGLRTGWLGRYLDKAGRPDNPLQGLSLDGELSPTIATKKAPVAALRGADQYSYWAPGVWGDVEREMLATLAPLGRARGARDKALASLANTATQASRLRNQLSVFTSKPGGSNRFGSPVPYPQHRSSFPDRLAGLAAMLAAGLPLRCVALRAYGMYDTHADQPDSLAQGLKLTSETLLAFQRDLEARGLADRVLTLVWSEFGRRGEENGSLGTDHGAAGVSLLMGTRARGQMVGELPQLHNALDRNGNLKATVDFRSIYTSLLEQWFDFDAAAAIPNARAYRRLQLVK